MLDINCNYQEYVLAFKLRKQNLIYCLVSGMYGRKKFSPDLDDVDSAPFPRKRFHNALVYLVKNSLVIIL